MNIKQAYLEALCQVFDDESVMSAIHTRTIPTLPDITVGSSNDAANLAASQFFANQNAFLKQFEGIPILQFLLMGCALSPVFHAINLSGLEIATEPKPHTVTPICPVEHQTFAIEEAITFAADVEGIDTCRIVSVKVTGPAITTIILNPVGGFRYAIQDAIGFQTAGSYFALFQAYFRGDYVAEQTINFEVI